MSEDLQWQRVTNAEILPKFNLCSNHAQNASLLISWVVLRHVHIPLVVHGQVKCLPQKRILAFILSIVLSELSVFRGRWRGAIGLWIRQHGLLLLHLTVRSNVKPKCGNNSPESLHVFRAMVCAATYCEPANSTKSSRGGAIVDKTIPT